jgi:hypothetical protein
MGVALQVRIIDLSFLFQPKDKTLFEVSIGKLLTVGLRNCTFFSRMDQKYHITQLDVLSPFGCILAKFDQLGCNADHDYGRAQGVCVCACIGGLGEF